jgi:hypothetical protein
MAPPPTTRATRGEGGAVLVLALIFMIIIALVLLAVVTLSGNDLTNTSHLVDQQSVEYSSAGATQVAIQTVRYTDTTYSGGSCFSSTTSVQIGQNSAPVYVDCSTVPPSRLPADTGASREINLYSCTTPNVACSATNYTIAATVDFVDGPTCGPNSIGACGTTESIKSWLVHGANG